MNNYKLMWDKFEQVINTVPQETFSRNEILKYMKAIYTEYYPYQDTVAISNKKIWLRFLNHHRCSF